MDNYREHPRSLTRPARRKRRRPRTSLRRSAPTSGGCTSAPIIIGSRCSTAATSRRSRTSSPATSTDFAPHSVLLDFTCGRENPALPYVGNAIREECGLDDDVRTIADVPSRSLLSRLTDHYLQIIANRAPIGFEAEFVNQRSHNICYRGILMPFSSDGEAIDFIYGVINWKESATPTPSRSARARADRRRAVPCAIADPVGRRASAVGRRPLDRGTGRHPTPKPSSPRRPRSPSTGRPTLDETRSPTIAEIVARDECRPRRPAVGRPRDRRGRQIGRRAHPRRALSRLVARL